MIARQKFSPHFTFRLFPFLAAIISFSCDRPSFVIESTSEDTQAYAVEKNAVTDWAAPSTGGDIGSRDAHSDSSLTITREQIESFAGDSLVVTETFDIHLAHKLAGDSTLDYGTVKFGGMELVKLTFQSLNWVFYSYTAQLSNKQLNSNYREWTETADLLQPTLLTISNSPDVKDTQQLLNTYTPVRIINHFSGEVVYVSGELEVVFSRLVNKGAVISIGSDTAGWVYNFTLLRPSSKVVIPIKYLQTIKGNASNVRSRLMVTENLTLEPFTSQSKNNGAVYRLPVFQILRHRISVTLN